MAQQYSTQRLYCTKDTHVLKSYPAQAFHSAEYTNMGVAGGQQAVALLAFDTNHGIPSGAKIISARLAFAVKYASDDGTYTYTVRPCSGTWTETSVTYNAIPTSSDVSDTVSISSSTRSIDITATFRAWFAGTYAMDNGLYITCSAANSRKQIYPHDYSNIDYRPYLTVLWEKPASVPVPDKAEYALGETLALAIQKADEANTHTVSYKIGDTVVRTVSNLDAYDAYPLPITLASHIPNAASAAMTICCETFLNGISQGTSDVSVLLKVPDTVLPTISAASAAEGRAAWPAALSGIWVQNASQPAVTISASGAQGSSITQYATTLLGQTVSGNPAQCGTLTSAGSVPILVTVTDSRGRSASLTFSLSVQAYAPPAISRFGVMRCSADGAYSLGGTYASITASGSASPLNAGNSLAVTVAWRASGAAAWTSSATGALSVSNFTFDAAALVLADGGVFQELSGYEFRLTATDCLYSATAYASIPTKLVVFDVHHSGTGMGFGKESEQSERYDFAHPIILRQGVDGALSATGELQAYGEIKKMVDGNGSFANFEANEGSLFLTSIYQNGPRRALHLYNPQAQGSTRFCLVLDEYVNSVWSNYYIPVQTDWIPITPADGVVTPGTYGNGTLRYRAEGKHVYIAGSINAAWDGASNKLIATLPEGNRPANGNSYFLQVRGGQNVARLYVNTGGGIYIEWVKSINDNSNNTGTSWLDLNMDFWID